MRSVFKLNPFESFKHFRSSKKTRGFFGRSPSFFWGKKGHECDMVLLFFLTNLRGTFLIVALESDVAVSHKRNHELQL